MLTLQFVNFEFSNCFSHLNFAVYLTVSKIPTVSKRNATHCRANRNVELIYFKLIANP